MANPAKIIFGRLALRSAPAPIASGEIPLGVPGESFVYFMYGADGDVLYVGVTDDLSQRIAGHATAAWRRSVRRIAWHKYASRVDAERAETYWIRELLPQFNVRDNGRRWMAATMGHRRPYDAEAWRRLGEVIREERMRMRWTQTAIARDAHVDVKYWRGLERGESTRHERELLESAERVLGWHPGSVESVLAGGEPNRLSEEERMERAHAEHAALALGERF